jgi:DNA-binding transcriptional LysR family regulator
MLPFFEATLKLLAHGAQSVHDVQSGAAGSLHIGALPAACHGEIMAGVVQFSTKFPQFHLHIEENNLAALHEHLDSGIYDAVLVRAPSPLHERQRFYGLQEDHSIVLASKGHHLARRHALTLQELAQEKWVVLPNGSTSRTIFENWFSTMPVRPDIVKVSTPALSALTALVAESDALIVLPRSFAIPTLATGKLCSLHVTRCDPLLPLGILWQPAKASVAAETFTEWMIARSTKSQ